MRTAWVIGGNGLLGKALVNALEMDASMQVVASPPIRWTTADAEKDIATAVAQCANASKNGWMIFWAAGQGTMRSSQEEMARETTLFQKLLEEVKNSSLAHQPGSFFFASTAGAMYEGGFIDELTPASPVTAYGKAKLEQEKLLENWQMPTCSIAIGRISNLYGSGQSRAKNQGLISSMARSIIRRKPVHLFVPLDTIRDYIHVRDAAKKILAWMKALRPGVQHTIIASFQPTTIAKIIAAFRSVTGLHAKVTTAVSEVAANYPHKMVFIPTKQDAPSIPLVEGITEVWAEEQMAYGRSA